MPIGSAQGKLRAALAFLGDRIIIRRMTTLKIKQSIDRMNEANRMFAAAYLKHLTRLNDPAHRAKLGARLRKMDAGRKISLDQVRRLHRELETAGL